MNTENDRQITHRHHEICILYGSQTNTAKFAAEELERDLWKYSYTTLLMAFDSYDITNLPNENFVIFIVSTTGYGEQPTNMKKSWRFLLRKELLQDSLCNVNYSIFGLGDSSYEKFNFVAKLLNSRLKQLSANLIHPVALGDDQHDFGYEGEFDPWCKTLIENLNKNYFPQKTLQLKIAPLELTPKYTIARVLPVDSSPVTSIKENLGKVKKLVKLTSDSLREIFHLEIEYEDEKKYNPGDVALIYPHNNKDSVIYFLKLFNLTWEDNISILKNPSYGQSEFPKIISCGEFFESWLNIDGIPNRHFCRIATEFTNEQIHKEKLLLFSSKTSEGKDEFYRYCVKERRSYVEFLKDFKTLSIPLEILIDLIGPIYPREYSISSSSFISNASVFFI